MSDFAKWLDKAMVEWASDQARGERSQKYFAAYLQISFANLLNYLNKGIVPEGENLKHIARKLGYEVYDILGQERPDARLDRIEELWPLLSESSKKRIADQINEYAAKHQ